VHMDISQELQEPFCVEFLKGIAGHGWEHLD
jgi:hypothetical protein